MKRTLFVSNLRSEDFRLLCRTQCMREAPEVVGRQKPHVPANSSSKLSTAPRAFAHLKNWSRHCEEDETFPCVVSIQSHCLDSVRVGVRTQMLLWLCPRQRDCFAAPGSGFHPQRSANYAAVQKQPCTLLCSYRDLCLIRDGPLTEHDRALGILTIIPRSISTAVWVSSSSIFPCSPCRHSQSVIIWAVGWIATS
jgi:hypothetical protein